MIIYLTREDFDVEFHNSIIKLDKDNFDPTNLQGSNFNFKSGNLIGYYRLISNGSINLFFGEFYKKQCLFIFHGYN